MCDWLLNSLLASQLAFGVTIPSNRSQKRIVCVHPGTGQSGTMADYSLSVRLSHPCQQSSIDRIPIGDLDCSIAKWLNCRTTNVSAHYFHTCL